MADNLQATAERAYRELQRSEIPATGLSPSVQERILEAPRFVLAEEREVARLRTLLQWVVEVVDVALDGSPGEAGDILLDLDDRLRAEMAT